MGRLTIYQDDVEPMRQMRQRGYTLVAIARHFQCSTATACQVIKGTYPAPLRHRPPMVGAVRLPEGPPPSPRRVLYLEDVPVLRSLRDAGWSLRQLSDVFGASRATVCQVLGGNYAGKLRSRPPGEGPPNIPAVAPRI